MKKILLLNLLLISIASLSFAQITRTSATFPVAWDEYETATDTSTQVTLTAAGPDQTWDFTALQAHTIETISVDAAAFGEDYDMFPSADVILPFGGGDAYVQVNANSADIIGVSGVGGGGGGMGFPDVFDVDPPFEILHSPLEYGNTYSDAITIGVPVAVADVPGLDTLLNNNNPLPIGEIDSIKLNLSIVRDEVIDGWGSITTPTGTYEVLRNELTDYTETGVEVYVVSPFGNTWIDASAFIPQGTIPIGIDTVVTHQYLDEVSKAPIAEYSIVDGLNGPITYQTGQVLSNKNELDFIEIKAYPNPAINFVNLEVKGLVAGNYQVQVYNIVGSLLIQEEHFLDDNETVRLNLEPLTAGTYLYSIQNEEGILIKTQRLIVRKP